METILVTVSVLSTLLVVGIVLAVVIVFNKFKGKVDVEKYKIVYVVLKRWKDMTISKNVLLLKI